jgi:small subunit ribosomal protein S16
MGKKKQPIYKMVAADSRSPRDGKFLEAVGFYNPLTNPHTLDLKEDRIMYWLNVGAQPTNTVKSLLRQKGITLKKELLTKGLDEEKVKSELENWQKMKEAGSIKKADRKLSKKAKAKQEAQASGEAAEKQPPVEETKKEAQASADTVETPVQAEETKPKDQATTETSDTADTVETPAQVEETKPEVQATAESSDTADKAETSAKAEETKAEDKTEKS